MIDTYWKNCTFLAVDVEGNGENPQELIELAIVSISGGAVSTTHCEWLVRPSKPITWQASRVHGIMNNDVSRCPIFNTIADSVIERLATKPIIGHKVSVDRALMQSCMPDWRPFASIDTWKLAKKVNPSLQSYSLSALIKEFHIDKHIEGRPHRAAYDAIAAAHLFVFLASKLDVDGKLSLLSLSKLSADANDPIFTDNQGSLF